MTIVVLGGNGLLGDAFRRNFPQVTVLSKTECNILSAEDLVKVFNTYRPKTVINCAGIVPKSPEAEDAYHLFKVNSFAPHFLQTFCDNYETRLIHISTDCVYSGISPGDYYEDDIPNPPDLYGLSKFLGEVTDYPHVTIRTSFVGLPDPAGRGLLQWASQERKVFGYDQVFWNGLTTTELADIIMHRIIEDDISGLLHVFGQTISKCELLQTAKEVFKWDLEVIPESTVREPRKINKTLKSIRFFPQTNRSFRDMLIAMKESISTT